MRPHLLLVWLCALPAAAAAPAQSPAPPAERPALQPHADCTAPEYHALDFWVGEWNVTSPSGDFQGDNRITPILGGCALRESWTSGAGGQGESTFFYDRAEKKWKQLWVTSDGNFKLKQQADAPEGAVRFEGEVERAGGGTALDRTTLRREADGTVRQTIEQSIDGGKTWHPWEGIYTRKKSACAGAPHAALDFWLGDWDVTVRARKTPTSEEWAEAEGSNHVTKADDGCTVLEDFHAAGPGGPWTGRSASQYVPLEKRWRQTWTDESNAYLAFTGGPEGNDFVLTGEPRKLPDGKTRVMRMVFSEIKPDALHWRWEGSTDGGKTWREQMRIDYRRHR